MKEVRWRKGAPQDNTTVLFKTVLEGCTPTVGYKVQGCMYSNGYERLCSIDDVACWVLIEEVEALIDEETLDEARDVGLTSEDVMRTESGGIVVKGIGGVLQALRFDLIRTFTWRCRPCDSKWVQRSIVAEVKMCWTCPHCKNKYMTLEIS